jgi:hypothetical protein
VHFFIFVQGLEIFFHLRDFVLEMEENAVVHALEAAVKRWECTVFFG